MAGTEQESGPARSRGTRGKRGEGAARGEQGDRGDRAKQGERERPAPKAASRRGQRPRGRDGGAAVGAAVASPRKASRNGAARAGAAAVSVERAEPVAVGGHAMIDLDFLRGLIDAVDASGIDSIEIARAGTRIRISKTPPPPPMIAASPAARAAEPAVLPTGGASAHADTLAAGEAPADRAPEAGPRADLVDVKSPMVGTFYRAPAPEAPPYVEVGSHVTKGQTLCILEAMKLMNELECEVDGVVREVLVDNTEPVEFGQVLFRIEPTKR